MKKMLLYIIAVVIFISYVNADCTFVYDNRTTHPVTLQGGYIDKGESVDSNWIIAEPNSTTEQTKSGTVDCNAVLNHSAQIITKIVLKNNSASWVGNKGFLFASDRSFANVYNGGAIADDESGVTLSNGAFIGKNKFSVIICDLSTDSNECN